MLRTRRNRLQGGSPGYIMALALAFLALGAVITVPALKLVQTNAADQQVRSGQTGSLYAADAGVEHVMWRILYQAGFAASLDSNPHQTYSLTVAGKSVAVDVTNVQVSTPTPPCSTTGTTGSGSGGNVAIGNSGAPSPIVPGGTVTYTLTVTNTGTSNLHMTNFMDLLPAGFTYVAGSSTSTGVVFKQGEVLGEPGSVTIDGRLQLTWPPSGSFASPQPYIPSGVTAQIIFRSVAAATPGLYCNGSSIEVTPNSISDVSLAPTQPVLVGWPQYDIISTASNVTIKARVVKGPVGMDISSWEVQ